MTNVLICCFIVALLQFKYNDLLEFFILYSCSAVPFEAAALIGPARVRMTRQCVSDPELGLSLSQSAKPPFSDVPDILSYTAIHYLCRYALSA